MVYENVALILGRLIFGVYFVVSGLNHFINSESISGWISAKDFPLAKFLTYFTGGQLILGGLSIVTGILPLVGLGALALFLMIVTPVFHDFWHMEGEERQNHRINFMKNLALTGAIIIIYGAREAIFI